MNSPYEDATKPGGNPIPKIFWLKARAGWIETSRREQVNINAERQVIVIGRNPDGSPQEIEF
jgi:hypothetical protein